MRREDEVVCREEVNRSAMSSSRWRPVPTCFFTSAAWPGTPEQPVTLAWEDVRPRLSADGRRVTFQVNRKTTEQSPAAAFGRQGTGWSDVVVVDRDSGQVERISSERGHCRSPVLSDDGKLLAYSSLGPDAVPCIFLRDLENGSQKLLRPRLVKSGRGGCFAPDFSADGRYLSCMTYRKADNLKRWRFSPSPGVMRLDEEQFETPFRGSWSTVHGPVALSPDGRRRVWESRGDHSYLAATEGNEHPQVLFERGFSPTISQDLCVFVAPDHRKVYQLMLHDFESGQTRALTEGNDDSLEPRLTPDGRWLVFSSYASDLVAGDTNEQCDVFLFDLDHQALTRVTPDSSDGPCYNPDLSADGSTVAFATLATNLETGGRPAGQVYVWERASGELEAMPFISR